MEIVEMAKIEFMGMIDNYGSDPLFLKQHVIEVERWANYLLDKYSVANKEIVY